MTHMLLNGDVSVFTLHKNSVATDLSFCKNPLINYVFGALQF